MLTGDWQDFADLRGPAQAIDPLPYVFFDELAQAGAAEVESYFKRDDGRICGQGFRFRLAR